MNTSKQNDSRDVLTVAEFKERIRALCGIMPANPLLTRTQTDKGFHPERKNNRKKGNQQ